MLSRKDNITKKTKKTKKTNNTGQKIQSKTYSMGDLGRGDCIINQIEVKLDWLGS